MPHFPPGVGKTAIIGISNPQPLDLTCFIELYLGSSKVAAFSEVTAIAGTRIELKAPVVMPSVEGTYPVSIQTSVGKLTGFAEDVLIKAEIVAKIFYNPYGCIRTGLYYCRHNPGYADTCDPTPSPVSPPYWSTRDELITSMEHLSRGWGGNFGGAAIDEDCGYCVSGEANRYTYGFADYHCPYCGQEFTYGPAGGGETYSLVLDQLLTHIEQSHPEFPLSKPPCWIIMATPFGRWTNVSVVHVSAKFYIDGVESGSIIALRPGETHHVKVIVCDQWAGCNLWGNDWTNAQTAYEADVKLENWGDRADVSGAGVTIITWESLTGERVPA